MTERHNHREVEHKPHGDGGSRSHARGQATEGLNSRDTNHAEFGKLPANQAAKDALPPTQIHDPGAHKPGGPGKEAPPPSSNPAKSEDQPAKSPAKSQEEKSMKMAELVLHIVKVAGNDNYPIEGNPPGATHPSSTTFTRLPRKMFTSPGKPANDN